MQPPIKKNGMPTKCERGTKCHFVPRALKSQLTKCRPPFSVRCPPLPFFLGVAVRASTRVIVRRLFFQICAVWAGLSLGAVWLNATLAQRDRSDGQMWKNVAHKMRTGNKMLFCSPRIKILAYQQLLSTRFLATLRAICVSSPTTYPPAVYHWDTAPTRAPWLKTPSG